MIDCTRLARSMTGMPWAVADPPPNAKADARARRRTFFTVLSMSSDTLRATPGRESIGCNPCHGPSLTRDALRASGHGTAHGIRESDSRLDDAARPAGDGRTRRRGRPDARNHHRVL